MRRLSVSLAGARTWLGAVVIEAAPRSCTAKARRPHASTSSCSARAPGSMPATTKSSSVARSVSDRRSVFRRCPKPARTRRNRSAEAGPHEAEQIRSWDRRRTGGHGAPADGDERGVDLRTGEEHRRWHAADDGGLGPVRHLDAHRAVGLGARAGGQPLADLGLHHDEEALDQGHVVQQVGDDRGGRVVRQVGHDHRRPAVQQRGPVELAGVAGHDLGRRHGLAEHLDQAVVELDRGDPRARLQQGEGERAQPGADLDDVVTGPDISQPRDAPDGVRIDDEVLTQPLARGEPVAAQQLAGLPRAEGHVDGLPGDRVTR